MRVNKNINCIRYALAAVWCAGTLILGGCSEAEGSTWKQEYITCMAAMEQGIAECGMAGKQEHEQDTLKQMAWDRVMELWQDSLSAFGECVETCIGNQSGEMDGEEDIYRTATLLMAAMCEEHNGSYEFTYEHGEDTEEIREDFRAVIEGENPIDESRDSLHEDFGIYYYADALITRMAAEAWEEEFYHCLDIVGNEVKQSGAADKEQILEILESYEDFFEVWVDNERAYIWQEYYKDVGTENGERYVWMELGRGGYCIWEAESRAEVFRIGTLLLAAGLEKSGCSYEFVYDSGLDRQKLTEMYSE